ncbi:hypothetical protein H4R19_001770 [Coemansia spiralis]|nr:hypothetical protein H4R19_001770 [Coemansia spiralis]
MVTMTNVTRFNMQDILVEEAMDTCAISYNEWCHLARAVQGRPGLQKAGELMLDTVAIVNNANSDDLVLPLSSNIPWIIDSGSGDRVKYVVFHAPEAQRPLPRSALYRRLAEVVCTFTGAEHQTSSPPCAPSDMSKALGELVEAVLCAMPNVQGILVACTRDAATCVPKEAARSSTYCAMAERMMPASPLKKELYIVPTRDVLLPKSKAQGSVTLPLTLSSLDFLSHRPLPIALLKHLEAAIDEVDSVCVHEAPTMSACHIRRHLYFNPAQWFVDSFRRRKAYDWCQIVVAENRVTGSEL